MSRFFISLGINSANRAFRVKLFISFFEVMLFKRKEVEDEEHLESEADESDSGQDYSVLNSFRELESRIKELEEIVMYKLIRAQHCKDGWFIREVVKVFAIADLIALKHEYRRRMRHLPRSPLLLAV